MPAPPPTCDETDTEISVDSFIRAVARLPTAPVEPRDIAEALYQAHVEHFSEVTRGRYELEALLGAGGMGVVYAAKNVRTQRPVAIKFLHPRPHEPAHVQRERALRFAREASAAGRIRHPNVVDIYDVEPDVATPYLVMERLEGESLRQRMVRAPLSVLEAVGIVAEAMRGVLEAHAHGVIHRDLKPDNIFLAEPRGSHARVVKVLDFGVSRLLTTDGTARPSTLTGIGHRLGTPAYMPIEQRRGDPDCDARVDVYALGVTLYEAICGVRPTVTPADGEGAAHAVGSRELVPLRARCPDVDKELSAIVMRAMSRERSQRFPELRSFALALDGWLSRVPRVGAAQVVVPLSARGTVWPKLWWVGLAAAALAVAMWLAREPARPPHEPSERRLDDTDVALRAAPRVLQEAPLVQEQTIGEAEDSTAPNGEVARDVVREKLTAPSAATLPAPSEPSQQPSRVPRVEQKPRKRARKARGQAPWDVSEPSSLTDPKRATELRSNEF